MSVQLDHFIVPSRDAKASARMLAGLLDVPWGVATAGPFIAVYLNEGLTLDYIDTEEDFPVSHYCFRVTDAQFDGILARLREAKIPFRSTVRGPMDMQVSHYMGGRGIYWNEPDGHQWEILTASYARAPLAPGAPG